MRSIFTFIALALLLTATPALAADKTACIAMQYVMTTAAPFQELDATLKESMQEVQTDLKQREEEIRTLRDEMQKQSMALSQEVKQDKEFALRRKIRDFQDLQRTYQRKLQAERQQLAQPVIQKVMESLMDYSNDKGYDYVFNANGGLLFCDESKNVTEDFISYVNAKHKAAQ